MATSLMSKPCGDACNQEAEYKVSFFVTSLEMSDKEKAQMFESIVIVVTWDGNVMKLSGEDEEETFKRGLDWIFLSTPENISKKLKLKPIMIDMMRECTELGTIKMKVSDCFGDAVLCKDFNSQTVTNEFKFINGMEENATMNAYFRVQKLLDDGASGSMQKQLKSKLVQKAKNKEKAIKGSDDCETDSENEICKDFVCPDELAENCKKILDQNVYRIINGILINTKDKTGPCGEECPVAGEYLKELCKKPIAAAPLSTRFHFQDDSSKCVELFSSYSCDCECPPKTCQITCPECCVQIANNICISESPAPRKPCQNDLIDRNIQEEDLLKKLCDKYGINVDEIRAVEQQNYPNMCEKKIKVKKLRKKKMNCVKPVSAPQTLEILRPKGQETRENFIKAMKCKARGKYSHEFGNKYPLHKLCPSILQSGSGDAATVPKYMGWRWNEQINGIGDKKWYPGRINQTVRCLMKHSLNPFPCDTLPLTRRDKNGRVIKTCNDYSQLPEFNPALVQKPTLVIQKRDGEYYVTMNPLKDKKKLVTDCNPFLNCSPLKFNIKRNPEEIEKHRAKKLLRNHGFGKKCSCLNLQCCRCMSENSKKLLQFEMKMVSNKLKLKKELTFADLGDSSDSELDLHFTTPAAIVDCRKCKPDVVHCEVQYDLKDFTPKAKKVEKKKKLMKPKAVKAPLQKPKVKSSIESINISPPCVPETTCNAKCC